MTLPRREGNLAAMTTEIDLDAFIRSTMDSGITHELIPADTAAKMRARLAEMLKAPHCLICAVRAMTEGNPKGWVPGEPGASVAGVVLNMGRVESKFVDLQTTDGTVPFTDLWTGTERIRVIHYGRVLQLAMQAAAPAVGDRLIVTFTQWGAVERGKFKGKPFRVHTVGVERGHH